MTYKEFTSKMEAYTSLMLNFKKESEEYLILYLESVVPIARLSLVSDDWKFINQFARFDAAFLVDAMSELADTPKEQRGDWE